MLLVNLKYTQLKTAYKIFFQISILQTYVLYHLRNIYKLDTLFISDEAKSFAEATFMKKKMYYNMRIKTMQRYVLIMKQKNLIY